LFKDVRRLLTKMGTTVKSDYTFSGVLTKWGEMFVLQLVSNMKLQKIRNTF